MVLRSTDFFDQLIATRFFTAQTVPDVDSPLEPSRVYSAMLT